LSVEALHDRLAPVEPAAAPVRPVGVEGGVVSTGGVVPTPLLGAVSVTPLQPANIMVNATVVTARSSKAFVRSMGILTTYSGTHYGTHYLGRHSEPLPVSKINDADDMSLAYDNGM
jgi:hypothetical protein